MRQKSAKLAEGRKTSARSKPRGSFEELPAHKAYRFLEAGPIVMVTTADKGKPNIMTMGFQMMMQHAPPLIGCVIGPWDHSYKALCETSECVIAIPTVDLATTVVDIGNCSGADIDKFSTFHLRPSPPAPSHKAPCR